MLQLPFSVFVCEFPDGSTNAWVLSLPEASGFEASRAEALKKAEAELLRRIQWEDRREWSRMAAKEPRDLQSLTVQVIPRKSEACVTLTVSVVVTTLERDQTRHLLITAPRLPKWELLLEEGDAWEEQARAGLEQALGKLKPTRLMEAAQAGDESLETVLLSLPAAESDDDDDDAPPRPAAKSSDDDTESVLELCGTDLTQHAEEGRLSEAYRREALLDRICNVLAAERRNSVLLVGRSDSGKTALVHELARRMQSGKVPVVLRDRQLWSITANNVIAGMRYTGEWQGRTQQLVTEVRSGNHLLYMGLPSEILDAGRWSKSDNNMGRFLRPHLESGDLTLICECSPESYEAELRREPSFIGAFTRIDVPETDEADTLGILHAVARRLEPQHGVTLEPSALTALVDLTRRFQPYRAFPGKAVRFLEEMLRDTLGEPAEDGEPRPLARAEAIESFTRATGLPRFLLADDVALKVPDVRTYFEERLLGQPDAVAAMVDLVTVLKAGLNDPQKPLGSFFFVGPTGVGKTEMAKVLAEFLFGSRERIARFDMSEYAAADALPRLIGSAWREESDGELTRKVREQPFSVILLDELEKAHPEVFDALLAVLGEGRLTDAGGRTADFRNSIIVMTSNLGASRRETQVMGFGEDTPPEEQTATRMRSHFVKEAEAFFRPEFFNRIDRIVAFHHLTAEAMRRITRRELGKLLMREGIVRRNLLVEIDDAVIERLVAEGFHPLYGARPLQREIERAVILPLARLLVDQGADHRTLLRFSVRDGQISLSLLRLEGPEEASAENAAIPPPPDRRLETDLAAVLRVLQDLRTRSTAEEDGLIIPALRHEVAVLMERTREPTFWDESVSAREVLRRVYRLERVLKRFDSLLERAEHLEERAAYVRRGRDRRGVPDLAESVERLAAEFSYLEVELAGVASGDRRDRAVVRVLPLGADSEAWAEQLVRMYVAWAERKGYEHAALASGPPAGRRGGSPLPAAHCLYVKGTNVYEFLRCEAGLHRLNQGTGEEKERHLARVSVFMPAGTGDDGAAEVQALLPQLLSQGRDVGEGEVGADAMARIYTEGRHRFVRDPRTGVRLTDIDAILQGGQIDPFLLARLRQSAAEHPTLADAGRR